MGIVRVDMQGVLSLKGNSLVDAVYVYVAPASMEAWAQQQSLRHAVHLQPLVASCTKSVLHVILLRRIVLHAASCPDIMACTDSSAS